MTAKKREATQEVRQNTLETRDIDTFMSLFNSLHAPVNATASTENPFTISTTLISNGGVCISLTRSSDMEIKFNDVFDGYGLTLLSQGNMLVKGAKGTSVCAECGGGLMLDSKGVLGASIANNSYFSRISITTEEMHKKLSDLIDQPVSRRIQFFPTIPLKGATWPPASVFSDIIDVMYKGTAGEAPLLRYPAAMASLRESVLSLILEGIPNSYSTKIAGSALSPSPRSVKLAIDFIAAHAQQPLRLADIAAAAGCSVRSLQSGFLKFKGLTPMGYLRMVRLSRVRAELISGNRTKISEVAYSWGFVHLSAFACFYQKSYGESPSDTLRRSAR